MPKVTQVSGLGNNTVASKTENKKMGAKKVPIRLLKNFLYLFLSPLFVSLELINQFVQIKSIVYARIGVMLIMIGVSIKFIKSLKQRHGFHDGENQSGNG